MHDDDGASFGTSNCIIEPATLENHITHYLKRPEYYHYREFAVLRLMNRHGAAATLRRQTEGTDVLDSALDLNADFGGPEFVPPQDATLMLHPPA
jgi:hypothetical protein